MGGAPYGIFTLCGTATGAIPASAGAGADSATPASACAARSSSLCSTVKAVSGGGFLPPHAELASAAPANIAARDIRPNRNVGTGSASHGAPQNGHAVSVTDT